MPSPISVRKYLVLRNESNSLSCVFQVAFIWQRRIRSGCTRLREVNVFASSSRDLLGGFAKGPASPTRTVKVARSFRSGNGQHMAPRDFPCTFRQGNVLRVRAATTIGAQRRECCKTQFSALPKKTSLSRDKREGFTPSSEEVSKKVPSSIAVDTRQCRPHSALCAV